MSHMKKLFLASSFDDVANLLNHFQENLKGKTVTFIPTASIVEEVVFYVEAGKKALEKLGLIVDVLELSTATPDEINTKLRNNDFIYVTGGNTFFLLQEMKKSGADKIIIDEVLAGKLYIGESGGAMVTSPNIAYVEIMDSTGKAPELKNFEALGLVDFYPVPHHTNPPFTEVVQEILDTYSSSLNLKAISNSEAILVEKDKFKIEKN